MLRGRLSKLDSIITDVVKYGGVIDRYIAEIKILWEANNQKWNTDNDLGFDFGLEDLRAWLISRQEWINNNIHSTRTISLKL